MLLAMQKRGASPPSSDSDVALGISSPAWFSSAWPELGSCMSTKMGGQRLYEEIRLPGIASHRMNHLEALDSWEISLRSIDSNLL